MLSSPRARIWIRSSVVVLVLLCAGYALYARWDEASAALASLSVWVLMASLAAALVGLLAQMLAWRALLADVGAVLSVPVAGRVMFLGQLGKYLPGSVWAFLAQVELAREQQVPRARAATATVLAVVVTLAVNLAVATATLPLVSPEAARRWWWVLALAPGLVLALHPRLVTALVRGGQRLTRSGGQIPAGELTRVSWRGLTAAAGWSVLAWPPLALHVWTLMAAVGDVGVTALPLAAGAFALAWTLGLVVVLAPAGVGVRELVLVVSLAPVLDAGAALVVAALSRLVLTLTDLLWAAAATLVRPGGRIR
ncbi:lysylphosphatidylglycerol synthase domain-containing protein [Lipingzhangella sp. LS1_29]|uniref:Lysylphosphatidylglycerol synthase domain-containing protein n=1 Tax=Lipingzhangella rawalii TaxID=2055835 RepID=A0ABU2H345_9ACTN|nr:lysylphosphatidylglycerol synthase domain-containing protein [Lipingzhangella rawalii]MDS1269721.1 lysylphosphatidylglycerol synthase domain-containing protein [Lipingzhangella rawalii]